MKNLILFILLSVVKDTVGQKSYFITGAANVKLHVQEFGVGKPVVILAGGPGLNAVYLEPIWENLSGKFRCIVLDQRGTGNSRLASIDATTVNMKLYVGDLEALRTSLNLERLTIIGHSWGGMLSMEYAARFPQRVEKLILLGSGGPTSSFFAYFGDNIEMRLTAEDKREVALLDSLKRHNLIGVWPGYFYDRERAMATKPTNDSLLFGQPGVSDYAIKDYVATQKDRVRLLEKFRGDVDLIQGRQDPIGASTVCEIRDLIPQTRIHFIEKCGHLPWLEKDAQVKQFFDLLHKSLL
ncbi:MAG: alpha/beta hydrolase [Bacteroidetes bacterium]|nr:alpha/beta hydrolase [Bacteroidota bacterium]